MNIFILDLNIQRCAEYHVDKHVVKMLLEYAQMLSTTVRLSGVDIGYKITHQNHPCTKWVRESLSNWLWLRKLATHLNDEWKYRYDHLQNCKAFDTILTLPEPIIEDKGLTFFPICMDEQFKVNNDPILSYRNYYQQGKQHILSWKHRDAPNWIQSSVKFS